MRTAVGLFVLLAWTAPAAAQGLRPACPALVDIPTRELVAAFRACGDEEMAAAYDEMLETPEEQTLEERVAASITPPRIVLHPRGWEPPLVVERVERIAGGWAFRLPHTTAVVHDDGDVTFHDRRGSADLEFGGGADGAMATATVTFDLTDIVAGLAGVDLLAPERLRFIDAIEERRAALELLQRQATLGATLGRLPARLAAIWRGPGTSAERRLALFEEWDDCADDVWGADARRIIIDFIRTELPAGSDVGFTTEEIRRLDATRLSEEAFRPYE